VLKEKDMKKMRGLRVAFATASPVLTTEVKKYYQQLRDSLRNYLRAKDGLRKKQKAGAFEEVKREEADDEEEEKVIQEQAKVIAD